MASCTELPDRRKTKLLHLEKEDVDYNLEPIYKLVEVPSMYFGKFGLKILAAVCILDVT